MQWLRAGRAEQQQQRRGRNVIGFAAARRACVALGKSTLILGIGQSAIGATAARWCASRATPSRNRTAEGRRERLDGKPISRSLLREAADKRSGGKGAARLERTVAELRAQLAEAKSTLAPPSETEAAPPTESEATLAARAKVPVAKRELRSLLDTPEEARSLQYGSTELYDAALLRTKGMLSDAQAENRDSKPLGLQLAAKSKWLADREKAYGKASARVSDVETRLEALRSELELAQAAAAKREAEIAIAQGELDDVERQIALERSSGLSGRSAPDATMSTADGSEDSLPCSSEAHSWRDERAHLVREKEVWMRGNEEMQQKQVDLQTQLDTATASLLFCANAAGCGAQGSAPAKPGEVGPARSGEGGPAKRGAPEVGDEDDMDEDSVTKSAKVAVAEKDAELAQLRARELKLAQVLARQKLAAGGGGKK